MTGVVPVSVKRLIVSIDLSSVDVSEFYQEHGISRWLLYDLRRRYEIEGDEVFEPNSRTPLSSLNRALVETEERIVEFRKALPDEGRIELRSNRD